MKRKRKGKKKKNLIFTILKFWLINNNVLLQERVREYVHVHTNKQMNSNYEHVYLGQGSNLRGSEA